MSAFTADASPTKTIPAIANEKLTLMMLTSQKRRHFCSTVTTKDRAFSSWGTRKGEVKAERGASQQVIFETLFGPADQVSTLAVTSSADLVVTSYADPCGPKLFSHLARHAFLPPYKPPAPHEASGKKLDVHQERDR